MSEEDRETALENEAEFMGYLIIASSADTFLAQSSIVNIDISHYNAKDHILLKEAIKIHAAIVSENFQRFFKLMETTNYLYACLMTHYLNAIRSIALNSIIRVLTIFSS